MENKTPTVGLVIGTYASVPYVHLQLAAWWQYYPTIPVLVHDDGSPSYRELATLCRYYGADCHLATTRAATSPPGLGDLSAFVQGLLWAERMQVDYLVKFSRRWIVLYDWATGFSKFASMKEYPTYSSYCTSYGFGFRTECLAMKVSSWLNSNFLDDAKSHIARAELCLPEMYIHHHAEAIAAKEGVSFKGYPRDYPFGGCNSGYELLLMLGFDRKARRNKQLWHDYSSPAEYHEAALSMGISQYSLQDFEKVN